MTDDTFSEVTQVRGLLGPSVSPYNSEGEKVLLPFLLHQYHQPPAARSARFGQKSQAVTRSHKNLKDKTTSTATDQQQKRGLVRGCWRGRAQHHTPVDGEAWCRGGTCSASDTSRPPCTATRSFCSAHYPSSLAPRHDVTVRRADTGACQTPRDETADGL